MTPSALRKSKNKTRLIKTDRKRTYLSLKKTRFPPLRSHRMDNWYIDKCSHSLYGGTRCKKFIQISKNEKAIKTLTLTLSTNVLIYSLLLVTCDLFWLVYNCTFDTLILCTVEAWTKWNAKKRIQHPMILEPKDYFQFKNCYWNTVWL